MDRVSTQDTVGAWTSASLAIIIWRSLSLLRPSRAVPPGIFGVGPASLSQPSPLIIIITTIVDQTTMTKRRS
jgi:hypothetical protein